MKVDLNLMNIDLRVIQNREILVMEHIIGNGFVAQTYL
jgi:hypothetical protein